MLESILQPDCKKVIKIKLLILAFFALKGCFSGILFRETESFLWIPYSMIDGVKGNLIPILKYAISFFILIIYISGYILVMKVFPVIIPQVTKMMGLHDKYRSYIDRFLPYFDLSWLWLACFSEDFFCGLVHLLRATATDSPGLELRTIIFVVFIVSNILLNYLVYPKVCPEEQKAYSFGLFVNSWINSLFRRLFGRKEEKERF